MARAVAGQGRRPDETSSAEALLEQTTKAQLAASDPAASAWVGANAGAGKTHVLKMRVLRLLLGGVKPERILCLTYTKAAAAEMSQRVFNELADWSTAETETLRRELGKVLGRDPASEEMVAARQLFAKAIETPGGLKVQTIHAFCERLLQRFPLEAGVPPGFEILDEATARSLMRTAIDRTLGEANAAPESEIGRAARHAIAYAADEQFDKVLDNALRRRAWLTGLDAMGGETEAAYQAAFALSAGDTVEVLEAEITGVLTRDDCAIAGEALQASDKKTDQTLAGLMLAAARAETAEQWRGAIDQIFLTQSGTVRSDKGFFTKAVRDEYPAIAERLLDARFRFAELRDRLQRRQIVDATVALATLAGRVMAHYGAQKAERAALDFEDLIARSAGLLERSGASAWVLYKLDGGLDHVLVDEAQDTSPIQWRVIQQLVSEFFAGEGQREADGQPAGPRTVFAVGDEKQSIYSFQGAAPEMFAEAGRTFAERAEAVSRRFERVPLELSFRTVSPLLTAVDHVFANPSATPGLTSAQEAVRHLVLRQGAAGIFELWDREPVEAAEPTPAFEPLEETTTASPVRRLAERIAAQVGEWLEKGERLAAEDRPIRASDILVLVRKRTPFAPEMVRAFKRRGIAVAGADRIVLGDHIAVQDLMSVADFLLLPEDDLALANILKSPLFGLDDEDLLAFAPDRPGLLWSVLLKAAEGDERFRPAAEQLKKWRSQADFSPPFEFFANLLDRDGGRARLIGRLGADAGDAIDEFMNLALNYDEQAPPSLQGFVTWLAETRREIKRDMEHGRDEVRVMTVHGSKGLEAPIVFLPDTCSGAASGQRDPLTELTDTAIVPEGEAFAWAIKGTSKSGPIKAARDRESALAQEEHNRLLYVAMTRARDRLYVGGFNNRTKKGMADGSWYDTIERGLEGVLSEAQDGAGQRVRRLSSEQTVPASSRGGDVTAAIQPAALPDWAARPAPREANLTIPIAPSRIEPAPVGEEGEGPGLSDLRDKVRPPLEPASRSPLALSREQSIQRGTLTHALLEHLPDLPPDQRAPAARRFLDARGRGLGEAVRDDIEAKVLAVLDDPQFAEAFGPASRAEVSIAAVVPSPDGKGPPLKVNGQIDRLVRTATGVMIIDFKSNRRPPAKAEDAPAAYLLQLAAYRMVVGQIYQPAGISLDNISAAFLWTDAAALMPVPTDLLDRVQTRLWEVPL
jgi:ATP-dependent helicase/nuclease subunit A